MVNRVCATFVKDKGIMNQTPLFKSSMYESTHPTEKENEVQKFMNTLTFSSKIKLNSTLLNKSLKAKTNIFENLR